MKKILAIAICSLPFALAPGAYAQSSSGSAAGGSSSTAGSTTTAPSGANRSSDGNATTSGANPSSSSGSTTTNSTPSTASGNLSTGASGNTGSATDATAGSAASATSGASASSDNSAAMNDAVSGWSVKDKIMGKTVYNENNDKVGDINDVILSRDGKATYVIIGVGGFIGMGERNVAIPFDKITQTDDKLALQGYTKDQLKEMPEFKKEKKNDTARSGAPAGGTPAPAGSTGTTGTTGTGTMK